MSGSATEFQFVGEFVSLLAAALGLALVVLRPELVTELRWGRVVLGAGFVATGAAAFVHGSELVGRPDDSRVLGLRFAGAALALAGGLAWRGGRLARPLAVAGATFTAVAAASSAAGTPNAANAALIAGGVAFGGAVLLSSGRSIAARIAASAAVSLLLFVLVLAVVLSAVVRRAVERDEVRRLQGRAGSEATAAEKTSVIPEVRSASIVGASLAADRLRELNAQTPDALASINDALRSLSERFFQGTQLLVVGPGPRVLAVTGVESSATALAIAGSDAVSESLHRDSVGSVQVVGGRAFSVGTVPIKGIQSDGRAATVAAVVAVLPLDRSYLDTRTADDRSLSIELVDDDIVLARFGDQPSTAAIRPLVGSAISEDRATTSTLGDRFVDVQPVHDAAGKPVFALVVSRPTSAVSSSRTSLVRTLFEIALGGTLLALLLAAIVGERIGAGLRRLTVAADSIRRGGLGVRVSGESIDEVGILGTAFNSMAQSIEDKTAAEVRLRSRLEAVVAGMGEALVAVDADGTVTDFNQAAEELVGLGAADAIDRPADEIVHLAADDGTPLGARLHRPSPTRWSATGTVETAEGHRVPVAVIGGPLRGPGNELAGGVFALRDLRPEREIDRMKTEFLSRIGHELRTPLTGIMGYAELLIRHDVPAERANTWTEEILKQSTALFRIVQMLEFFASTGANRTVLRSERVDVRSVVDDAVQRWSSRLDSMHSLGRRVARDLQPVVADARWLALSLDELIDNAFKFSPTGGRVQVLAGPASNGTRSGVELAVVDRGNGMTEQELAIAFADFTQGDSSDTRLYGGLGLGLPLVQRVVEAHGGSVSVESHVGKGSKVSMFLPSLPMS